MNIHNQFQQQNIEFGSKKVPRYIYHLTSHVNYKGMLEDGYIRKESIPRLYLQQGVYALELSNFFKFWGTNKAWGYDNLQEIILRHIVKWINTDNPEKSELVMLRIPTSKLDEQKLFVRSLNKLFSFKDSHKYIIEASDKLQRHLTGNTSAVEAPLYKMRKEAIEYIYNDNIPIRDIEQIGSIVHIPSLRKDKAFSCHPIKSIMDALLVDTPELKNLKLLK